MARDGDVCELTWLPHSMCAHCRGLGFGPAENLAAAVDDDPLSDPAPRPARGIHAERDSVCPGCGEEIRQGELIVLRRDMFGQFVCSACGESDEALR